MASSTAAAVSFANLASCSSSISGSPVSSSTNYSIRPSSSPSSKPSLFVCRSSAQKSEVSSSDSSDSSSISRRSAISIAAVVAAAAISNAPAHAAYGDAANIFAAPKKDTGFVTVSGDGFKLNIPAKWNPSKEQEFPGTVLRYEDNFDANSNLAVLIIPAEKDSIKAYGTPEQFLESVSFLLGKQAYSGQTASEGGFDANAVAIASILESSTPSINGKDYYNISILTRTADGDEGGKHQIIAATVSGGKLYVCKAQAGDKRWFKGAKKFVEGAVNSFSVA